MTKKTIAALVIFLILGAAGYILFTFYGEKLTAFAGGTKPDSEQKSGWSAPPAPVATIVAQPVQLPSTVSGIGTIEASRQVDLASEVSGRIQSINFRSGQKVRKGDIIIRLNDETEEAELARLNVKLELAGKQYNRARRLKGTVTQSRIDEDQSNLNEIRAQIASTKTAKNKKTIVAPFEGVLGIRKVNLGQYLNIGEAIVNLTDITRFNVDFRLPEKASSQLKVGQLVRLMVDALDDQMLMAKVMTIEPQIERGLHTILVQGEVIDPPIILQSGMFVEATVDINRDQQVIMVPETAVERTTFGNTVYIVKAQTDDAMIVEQITVETGKRVNGRVVISKGMTRGQIVVVSGQNRLFPGAPVVLKAAKTTVNMTVPARTISVNHMSKK